MSLLQLHGIYFNIRTFTKKIEEVECLDLYNNLLNFTNVLLVHTVGTINDVMHMS